MRLFMGFYLILSSFSGYPVSMTNYLIEVEVYPDVQRC